MESDKQTFLKTLKPYVYTYINIYKEINIVYISAKLST